MASKSIIVCKCCGEPKRANDGTLYCCNTQVCPNCVLKLVFGSSSICPFCARDAKAAVMEMVAREKAANPDEAHFTSLTFATSLSDFRLPIEGHTRVLQIMEKLTERLGHNLFTHVEGGYVDYKLHFRNAFLSPEQTMYDAGWINGIAKIALVECRTPAAYAK